MNKEKSTSTLPGSGFMKTGVNMGVGGAFAEGVSYLLETRPWKPGSSFSRGGLGIAARAGVTRALNSAFKIDTR